MKTLKELRRERRRERTGERDDRLVEQVAAGVRMEDAAREAGLSRGRAYQIYAERQAAAAAAAAAQGEE